MSTPTDRPEERFAGDTGFVDLSTMAGELIREAGGSKHGHAQQTLYKHGHTTVALFGFVPGGELTRHSVSGVVTIQVIAGDVLLETPDGQHRMPSGHLARFAPGTEHEVRADAEAAILVHVALDPSAT